MRRLVAPRRQSLFHLLPPRQCPGHPLLWRLFHLLPLPRRCPGRPLPWCLFRLLLLLPRPCPGHPLPA